MSKTIQETFLELDWGDEEQACQARDTRSAQLQQEGYICTYKNLYTVYGYRVFLLEAAKPQPVEEIVADSTPKIKERPALRPKRHHLPSFEAR